MKIIYDFGANNGDDIVYYLKKCDVVVAVEANPALTNQIQGRFAREIGQGRLAVVNCALSNTADGDAVPFWLHKREHVRSQFPRPADHDLHDFEQIMVTSRRPSGIVRQFGLPYYIKIDVEGYDNAVLRELFAAGIRPEYISAESHHVDVFTTLAAVGGYQAFKLVDGATVSTRYRDAIIQTAAGQEHYSFPDHAAGPFGEDIAGGWMTADTFFKVLAFVGLGWRDVHAARDIPPDPAYSPPIVMQVTCQF
jgi:FkbM family methyltransferase